MSRMPCSRHQSASAGQEALRRHDEAALALDRLDDDRRRVVLADLGVDLVGDGAQGLLGAVLGAARPAVGVGHRHAVELVGERPEAVLVGHVLGGQAHREVGAAVVGVVEGDDRRAAGGVAGDLHGVLDGLGAGVEQRRALLVVAGGQLVELLADLHVLVVRRDHEAGVREGGDLLGDGVDDPLVAVADRRHGDAGAEVDELVAVGVAHDAARPLGDVHRQPGADAGGDRGRLARLEGLRGRAGDGRREDPLLLDHGGDPIRTPQQSELRIPWHRGSTSARPGLDGPNGCRCRRSGDRPRPPGPLP